MSRGYSATEERLVRHSWCDTTADVCGVVNRRGTDGPLGEAVSVRPAQPGVVDTHLS